LEHQEGGKWGKKNHLIRRQGCHQIPFARNARN